MENTSWKLKTALIAAPVLLLAVIGGRGTFVRVRQDLARQRTAIETAWQQVNAALEERSGLVRSLGEAARAASREAAGPAGEVAEASAALARSTTPRERIEANRLISDALAKVLLCAEKDRRLASDRTFIRLGEQVRDSEERVAEARRKYNENLEHYNARIQQFPSNLVARISGFERNDAYFQTEPF